MSQHSTTPPPPHAVPVTDDGATVASQKREEQLRYVLDATGAGVFDIELSTGAWYLAPNVGVIFGFGAHHVVTHWSEYRDRIHPDDMPALHAISVASRITRRTLQVDCRINRMDGSEGWIRIHADIQEDARTNKRRAVGVVLDITVERQAAAALKQSEQQLNNAQRISGIGSWSWRIATNTVTWSDEMFRIMGLPSNTVPSFELVLASAIDDAHREQFLARVQHAVAGDSSFDFEMPIRRADGSVRVLHRRGEVERDVNGSACMMTGTVEDVTDRRQSEEALRRSERELERAQQRARMGSFVRSLDSGELWWSNTARAILEFALDEVPSLEGALSRFDAVNSAKYLAAVQHSILTGEPYEVEAETVLPSGRQLVIRMSGEVDRDDVGRPISVHGVIADITAQRAQEQALRESEERFRTLWEASPIGIRLTDAQGASIYANPRLLELSDCTLAEFLAERWREGVHPDDRTRITLQGIEAVRDECDMRAEFRFQGANGRVRYLRATVAAVRTPDGRFSGHVGAIEDITQESEAAIERAEIEIQLRRTQKLESLGVLAGGIAHDFNNLLVGVLTNASMALLDLPVASPARETVLNIERAAQRAADLTRQLLAYSGKGRFIIESISLSDLAAEMLQLLKTVVSKRATLTLDLSDGLPLVKGDATQLRQILMNVITNASDSLNERNGEILLRTRVAHVERAAPSATMFGGPLLPGRYVVVDVIDSGSGMADETLQRIFDPFYTTKFTGRGLGLAATLGIVRGHGGAVEVTSTVGAGTTFSLYFPPSDGVRREMPLATVSTLDGYGTILVVDDDAGVRSVARSLLVRRGFTVLLAENGREAVDLFALHHADIRAVLLDLTMPVMDGEDALRELRKTDTSVPVILMSGYSDVDIERTFTGAGLAGFVQKPFRVDVLYQTLATALSGQRQP